MAKLGIALLRHPIALALGVAVIFSLRFIEVLPFSGFSKTFNQETVATLVSFFMFAKEPWSFPIGSIRGLAFPLRMVTLVMLGLCRFSRSFSRLWEKSSHIFRLLIILSLSTSCHVF